MNNCDLWKRVQEYVLQIYLTIKIESSSVCNVCIFFVFFIISMLGNNLRQIFISFRVFRSSFLFYDNVQTKDIPGHVCNHFWNNKDV